MKLERIAREELRSANFLMTQAKQSKDRVLKRYAEGHRPPWLCNWKYGELNIELAKFRQERAVLALANCFPDSEFRQIPKRPNPNDKQLSLFGGES